MKTDIYDLHAKAFDRVSAFVVMRDSERVATVAIKFPADGAGRLYAYIHWIGLPMVRGVANGYGYDKRTAACVDAARKLHPDSALQRANETGLQYATGRPWLDHYPAFVAALQTDDGNDWARNLEKAGFTVWQAV
jgi:hypothetical protein